MLYLIGAAVAMALGFGLAVFVGVKGSTPEAMHSAEVAAESEETEAIYGAS